MADNIQFRVDAVLGNATRLQQQIQNLKTNLTLTIDNRQALQAVQAVQQQINNLQRSMNNMNFNFGGNGGRGGGTRNGGGNGVNASTAQFETTTLQKTESLYRQISNTVNGTVKNIQVLRNEQGQIVSGVVTVSNGFQTWRRNLEFVDGQFQRVIASGRDNISLEQRSNEMYREREQHLKNISSIRRQLLTATGEERQVLEQQLQAEQRLSKLIANRISRKNSSGVAMYQTDEGEARIAQLKTELAQEEALATARVRNRQTITEQNENYRQQIQLVREIEALNNKYQTASPAQKATIQAEIDRKQLMLDNLQTQNNLTQAQQNEIIKIREKAQLQRNLVDLKKQELNASYGNVEEHLTGRVDTDELIQQTQWYKDLNNQFNDTATIVKNTKSSINQYGEEISQCTVKVKTANNQWQTYNATINNTTGELRVLKGQTTEIINSQMNLSTMLKSAIERFAVWGVAMKVWTSVGNAVKDCTAYVKDLNEAMTNIRVVTMDTKEATEDLLDTYNQLGQELGADTLDIAEGAIDWLRQGYDQADTAELVKDSTILSKLALIDNAEATEYLTSALKGYKLEAQDAIGVIDQLVSIDLEAATSAGDMAEAMSRTANMARTTGVEMNELLGMIATIAETTQMSASTVGNAMKTVFSRMSNVKAGVDNFEGEALNDVEKTLNRVGIALRDNQGNWYDFYDVLDEVASRWDSFNDVQQSQITTALGGTRQRENILVAIENWDKVRQYAQTGADSAGTAMDKYGIILESVSAKQSQLTAKMQEFYTNVFSDEFITKALDIANGFMDITNAGDGLLGKILLLTTAILALNAVITALKGTKIADFFIGFIAPIKNGITAIKSYITYLVGMTASLKAVGVQSTITAGAMVILDSILTVIEKHPVIFALSALIAVVAGGIAIFNAFNVTLEEQHEKAQQAQSDYQEIASELQSVNDELKTTKQRIDELNAKDKLSFTEEEELENLKKTNAELEKRQYWLDLEAKNKKAKATKEASEAWDKDFNKNAEYTSRYKYQTVTGNRDGQEYSYNQYDKITESEYIQEQIQYYGELEQKIQDLADKKGQWTEDEKKQYESLVNEQEKTKQYLETTGAKIQTDFIDAYDVDNATKQKWIDLQDIIQEALNPSTKASKLESLLDEQTQDWNNYYTQLAKMGELSEDSFTDSFKGQIRNAFNLDDTDAEGLSKVLEQIIKHFGDLAKESGTTSESLDKVAKTLSDLTEKYDLLKEAQDEYNEAGSLSSKTLDSIIEKYPAMAENVALYIAGLKSEAELLNDLQNAYNADETNYENLMKAKLLVSSQFYNNLTTAQKTKIQELFESYSADFSNFKTVEEAKLAFNTQIIQKLAQNWSKYAGKSVEFLKQQQSSLEIMAEKQYRHGMSNTNAQQEYLALTQAIKDMESFANSLDDIVLEGVSFNAKTFSPAEIKSATSGSKSEKEWWETELEKLKDQLEYNVISMDTYISGIENIRNKLKQGSDAWNEVNKELQEAKLEQVENQFKRGEITIDQYISKLEELRKAYNKNTEGYKELTQTINESKADNFADQYERGQISLEAYIKELSNLRDGYKKNSEEWKKYNDLINDTKYDYFSSQYERNEISIDQYISKLKSLQSQYKKGSEEYKKLADEIDEIELEKTEKFLDKLQGKLDDLDQKIDEMGEINTDKEKVKYAQLLSEKYKQIQSDISSIQKELKKTNLTDEQRKAYQEQLNDLLVEEVNIRDEIEDQVRTYFENQKEEAEQQAELAKKQRLYNKELELYGKKGKELFEFETNKKIDAINDEIEAREKEKEALDKINEREQLSNDLLEAKIALQNALNNKTTKILKKQEDGTWQYEYSVNMADVKEAQEAVSEAEKALKDYDWEQSIEELRTEAEKLQNTMDDLAEKYEEEEFWAEREYEQIMNSIAETYSDIDSLVQKWMGNNDTNTTKLTTAYQNLVDNNIILENALSSLATALEGKYETVGNKGAIIPSFDTGGTIVGDGLIVAHDKERVLTAQQNAYFEQLLAKLPTLIKAIDITKFSGYIGSKVIGSRYTSENANSTIISKVECVFPNITSTDGLQKAILELPRLALQKNQ